MSTPLLNISNLHYSSRGHTILNNICLKVFQGSCLALVGESGSGKSSLAMAIMGIIKPSSGTINFANIPNSIHKVETVQIVFQDIHASLNPSMTVGKIICEPLKILQKKSKKEFQTLLFETLELVNLPRDIIHTIPSRLSGGQKQRVAIARAIITNPRLLICDEPLSSLDTPNQIMTLELFKNIKDQRNHTILFITHDMPAAYSLADQIAVMHKGSIVEIKDKEDLFRNPEHFHTKELMAAIPQFCLLSSPTY
ncbi:ABC transporter ATP-binding protein [Chlamydiifrater phoenicopteri]|uniref:ABC transporter ATP-binding protein n=1 Tax=Chlamydiifrater phoenicopteri TaxID=2681469 RepID=UPI001BCD7D83|nr:ABC transporter ATP-binding protein [Chlamydiifrater phoenicopteri]